MPIKFQFPRLVITGLLSVLFIPAIAQKPSVQFTVSFPNPGTHELRVEMEVKKWASDTLLLKMPKWMPGYYQLIDYAASMQDLMAKSNEGRKLEVINVNNNTWKVVTGRRSATISYLLKTGKKFVANNYVDSAHAYVVSAGTFLYIPQHLDIPVTVRLKHSWRDVATGFDPVATDKNIFTATNFDILYDSPILLGDLEIFPSFRVRGIEHRFMAYNPGEFDKTTFMNKLQKVVEAAVNIIGDIPYKRYTFIGIGPGQGGIEHLNNTTISFSGKGLNSPEAMNRVMNFLAHEYFHHYNVKRIRPFELGPFDYDKENKTNLLWVSEGLSVYYEYLVVKRAGLSDERTLLSNFERNITAFENGPGRLHQSLVQASYETWTTGPFGRQGKDANRSISYYDKGPVVGLFLDFTIRNATGNKQSLDDVMRLLYWKYYKELQRGFTDAEFQLACETIAGMSLKDFFENVYTAKELDYRNYLAYAGLDIVISAGTKENERKFTITKLEKPELLQSQILESWMEERASTVSQGL